MSTETHQPGSSAISRLGRPSWQGGHARRAHSRSRRQSWAWPSGALGQPQHYCLFHLVWTTGWSASLPVHSRRAGLQALPIVVRVQSMNDLVPAMMFLSGSKEV